MPLNVQIVFYSLYGHTYALAGAIAEGAQSAAPDAKVELLQVEEQLPPGVLEKMGANEAKKAFAHVPIADPDRLADADAILLGSPTRYGHATASMQTFLDQTGGLWKRGALVGKAGGMFTSTGSQHGGQETTLMNLSTFFYHMGMVIVGVPYAAKGLGEIDEVSGGSPYGSTTIAGSDGSRKVSENELSIARYQGKHTAEIARKLAGK